MSSHHDKLQVMNTEEILRKNVYDLQEQLVIANKKVVSLKEAVERLKYVEIKVGFFVRGVQVYVDGINNVLNELNMKLPLDGREKGG
mgnify:CR=1 FL=1|tara:strand:+ start:255 stop:515 length:261 start_codon:yes stop_codon:yes gene_type:complete